VVSLFVDLFHKFVDLLSILSDFHEFCTISFLTAIGNRLFLFKVNENENNSCNAENNILIKIKLHTKIFFSHGLLILVCLACHFAFFFVLYRTLWKENFLSK
jgi:ABC-type uncharacterized transport system permease subunit